ncbi:hypothetical protein HDV05_000645 [Chytridiales sp. JEL 0842]|nr:hypothetical protein HDV05_000645 [Chytridiales sp. JEL 0842]
METLCETLDVLASHSIAKRQYTICLAMEVSEPESESKALTLIKRYEPLFYQILYTLHPTNLPNEIRGKSSNVAWASTQISTLLFESGVGEKCVLTVMDADTCFAEDYFKSVSYHYCIQTPEKRKSIMFTPLTVFDRNAHAVPAVVRVTDIFWSLGVMSHLYPSSPIRFPCSAYSLSLTLASAVNFWDPTPEAIGEDMHMYLKCFFHTRGALKVVPIYSPASQCNIQGPEGGGWLGGVKTRYGQAVRHMWGCLDTGFALRRCVEIMVLEKNDRRKRGRGVKKVWEGWAKLVQGKVGYKPAKEDEEAGTSKESLEIPSCEKTDDEEEEEQLPQLRFTLLFHLIHRLLEAHIILGHMFILLFLTSLFIPLGPTPNPIATYLWTLASPQQSVNTTLMALLDACGWIRFSCVFLLVGTIVNYERYHHWVCTQRWALAALHPALSPQQQKPEEDLEGESFLDPTLITSPNNAPKVQYLGRRPQLSSPRTKRNYLDWFLIPVGGILYQTLPQVVVQVSHMWTNRIEYRVAAKPQLKSRDAVQDDEEGAEVGLEMELVVHEERVKIGVGVRVDSAKVIFESEEEGGEAEVSKLHSR